MIGAVFVGAASVLAAYSTSAEMLIATRALLSIAAATLMPSTLALISNMFTDPHQRGRAVAVWASCFMGGVRRSARSWAVCSWSSSGGARCSCSVYPSWCCC